MECAKTKDWAQYLCSVLFLLLTISGLVIVISMKVSTVWWLEATFSQPSSVKFTADSPLLRL